MKSFIQLLLFLMSASAFADQPLIHKHSAMRGRNESAKHAFERYRNRVGSELTKSHTEGLKSALDMARPMNKLDFSKVPDWGQTDKAQARFEFVRNLQFVKDETHNMKRRSTWLYPDDGCFARAGLMVQNLSKKQVEPMGKVFIFGDLKVATKNSPNGSVSWWYHVVPIVKINGKVVVFDPAVYPKHPLLLKDWVAKLTNKPASVKMSLCGTHAYVPSSACDSNKSDDDKAALSDQMGFLEVEWRRVKELGRNPEEELGDSPPWLKQSSQQARN